MSRMVDEHYTTVRLWVSHFDVAYGDHEQKLVSFVIIKLLLSFQACQTTESRTNNFGDIQRSILYSVPH
jgi:hypothetical protein